MSTTLPIHNKNNFLFSISSTSVEVHTKDVNNRNTNTLDPSKISFTYVSDVNIAIRSKTNDNILLIRFSTNTEAIEALVFLKLALDQVTTNIRNLQPNIDFYQHHQTVSSNSWTFTHGLNRIGPVVILDDNFNQIIGQVSYTGLNIVNIQFNQALTGYAYI